MRDILVLNADYSPIQILSLKKALKLIMKQRATVEKEHDGFFIHSATAKIPFPSVIKLNHFIKYQRKPIQFSKRAILLRDKYTCQYCGINAVNEKSKLKMTIDHIVPSSRGGKNDFTNTVAACVKCNTNKGNKSLKEFEEEYNVKLNKIPRKPSPFMFLRKFQGRDDWEQYLFIT